MNTRTFDNPIALRSVNGISALRVIVDRVPLLNDAANPNPIADTPERVADALRQFIVATDDTFETERFFTVILSTRRRIIGIHAGPTGTLDTILVHPREVFRVAIAANAAAIVVAHIHPSGDPAPSESDIKVTRDLIKAGQLLKIEVLDHVILANPALLTPGARGWASLRELGYFYA